MVRAVLLFAALVVVLAVWSAVASTDRAERAVGRVEHAASQARLLVATGGAPEVGKADGFVEQGGSVSAFAAELPAIARLDPELRDAVQQAARDAEASGVGLAVTSGWRSVRYQQHLFDEAVDTYGSPAEAARFVLAPNRSAHVHGRAVDVGPTDAADWLGRHGSAYGLCQTYANEMWHFERVTAPGGTCPPQRADATG